MPLDELPLVDEDDLAPTQDTEALETSAPFATFHFRETDRGGAVSEMQIACVQGLGIDALNAMPVVVLLARNGRTLPIVIGEAEFQAIRRELTGERLARPQTHDLLHDAIATLGGRIERVEISELADGVYRATIILNGHGQIYELDARPSDSIALALREEAPILIASDLLTLAPASAAETPQDVIIEEFRSFLDQVTPGDFAGDAN